MVDNGKNLSECMHTFLSTTEIRSLHLGVKTTYSLDIDWPPTTMSRSIDTIPCMFGCNHHSTFLGLPQLTKRCMLHSSNHQSPRYLPSLYTHTLLYHSRRPPTDINFLAGYCLIDIQAIGKRDEDEGGHVLNLEEHKRSPRR